ncbi:MAG: response regulator transcription factor [Candidatus Saccharimonadales bacterium]
MRILVIEDNKLIAQAIKHELKAYYSIDIVFTGSDGLAYAQVTSYDIILLDLHLPDIDGQEVCRTLRKRRIKAPIIVISGKDQIQDKINLLDIGADDYLTKPFNVHELRARINVALRRATNTSLDGMLKVGDLELNPATRIVVRCGKLISLRRKEFDLLELLMRYPGQTMTRITILDHIWDRNENSWANVVDVHINHLRDKIDRPFGSNLIKTVHGLGYKLEDPLRHSK